MNKITFVLGILIVIGLVPLNHSQSNPIIPPWISEFSTNPDWIEFTTEGMDNWEYVYFHVNGQLVTVNPGVYTNDDHIILDISNTSGFDLPDGGGEIYVELFGSDTLAYGSLGVIPAPPAGESSAFTGNYSYEDDGWNIDPTPSPGDYNSTADVIFGDGTLFINEVYPDSSLPQPAFIELYNHSDQTVDISGWSIIANSRYQIPPGAQINGRGFYSLTQSQFPNGFDLSRQTDNVYLQNDQNELVDQLGWSTDRGVGVSLNRIPDGYAVTHDGYNDSTSVDFRNGIPTPDMPNQGFPVISIDLQPDTAMLSPGGTFRFHCFGLDTSGYTGRICPVWDLTDSIGTIDSLGLATGIRCGEGVLGVSYNGMEDSSYVLGAVYGGLQTNFTWKAEHSPYYVGGDYFIYPNATLTIEPGVKVVFSGYHSLYVNGSIYASGEVTDSIMFTSGKANPAPVDWNCIHIGSGPMSIFDYVIMEYSGGGIRHYNPSDALNLSVSHSTLRKNNSALSLDGNAIVTNNLIIVDVPSQFSRGILVQHDSVQIINNTIVEGGFGIRLNSCNPTIENNIIYNSQNGIYDQNSDSNPAISYNDVLALQQNFVNMHPELGVLSTTNFNGDSCDIFYNISLDPLFVDVNSGNYHLAPNSPCVDAGDPAILDPDSTISDMGAYGGGTVVKIINRRPNMVVKKYKLFQNYPNPFNPTTTINYQLPIRTKVELTIYNLLGQQIKTLVDSKQIAGDYKVQWDGSNDAGRQVASGIYVYRLKTEGFVRSRKMLLLR